MVKRPARFTRSFEFEKILIKFIVCTCTVWSTLGFMCFIVVGKRQLSSRGDNTRNVNKTS